MTKRWESQLVCGWGWTFAFHTTATVALQLTLLSSVILSAEEPRAGQPAITLLTTWSLAISPQQEFPSLKSRCNTGRAIPYWREKTRRRHACSLAEQQVVVLGRVDVTVTCPQWLSYTLTEPLLRQVQQQRWQPLAKRRYMSTSVLVTSLSRLR